MEKKKTYKYQPGQEILPIDDYLKCSKKTAKFDIKKELNIITSIVCPRCKADLRIISVGESQDCDRCGLFIKIMNDGTSLLVKESIGREMLEREKIRKKRLVQEEVDACIRSLLDKRAVKAVLH